MGYRRKSRSWSSSVDSREGRRFRRRRGSESDSRSECSSASRSGSESPKSKRIARRPWSAWENIVLYYLTKLKNYCTGASDRPKETDGSDSWRNDLRCAIDPASSHRTVDSELTEKRKAKKIVQNALEYGVMYGLVKRKGNDFKLSPNEDWKSYKCEDRPYNCKRMIRGRSNNNRRVLKGFVAKKKLILPRGVRRTKSKHPKSKIFTDL